MRVQINTNPEPSEKPLAFSEGQGSLCHVLNATYREARKKQGDLTDTAGWGPSYRGDPVATKVSPFLASCPITAQELGYLSSTPAP